jgi:hypothetical protein
MYATLIKLRSMGMEFESVRRGERVGVGKKLQKGRAKMSRSVLLERCQRRRKGVKGSERAERRGREYEYASSGTASAKRHITEPSVCSMSMH